jgi:hypothetical protein
MDSTTTDMSKAHIWAKTAQTRIADLFATSFQEGRAVHAIISDLCVENQISEEEIPQRFKAINLGGGEVEDLSTDGILVFCALFFCGFIANSSLTEPEIQVTPIKAAARSQGRIVANSSVTEEELRARQRELDFQPEQDRLMFGGDPFVPFNAQKYEEMRAYRDKAIERSTLEDTNRQLRETNSQLQMVADRSEERLRQLMSRFEQLLEQSGKDKEDPRKRVGEPAPKTPMKGSPFVSKTKGKEDKDDSDEDLDFGEEEDVGSLTSRASTNTKEKTKEKHAKRLGELLERLRLVIEGKGGGGDELTSLADLAFYLSDETGLPGLTLTGCLVVMTDPLPFNKSTSKQLNKMVRTQEVVHTHDEATEGDPKKQKTEMIPRAFILPRSFEEFRTLFEEQIRICNLGVRRALATKTKAEDDEGEEKEEPTFGGKTQEEWTDAGLCVAQVREVWMGLLTAYAGTPTNPQPHHITRVVVVAAAFYMLTQRVLVEEDQNAPARGQSAFRKKDYKRETHRSFEIHFASKYFTPNTGHSALSIADSCLYLSAGIKAVCKLGAFSCMECAASPMIPGYCLRCNKSRVQELLQIKNGKTKDAEPQNRSFTRLQYYQQSGEKKLVQKELDAGATQEAKDKAAKDFKRAQDEQSARFEKARKEYQSQLSSTASSGGARETKMGSLRILPQATDLMLEEAYWHFWRTLEGQRVMIQGRSVRTSSEYTDLEDFGALADTYYN